MPRRLLLIPALLLAGALPLAGQDVELLSEIYGTRPPDAYYEVIGRNPNAFRFSTEGRERMTRLRDAPRLRASAPPGAPVALSIGPQPGPVLGTMRIPLVLGLFSDMPAAPPFSTVAVQQHFFEWSSQVQTIPQYYSEQSGGLFSFEGDTYEWVRTAWTRTQVTVGPGGGLSPAQTGGVGGFIESILAEVDDGQVDWSLYDGDGDGYVDVLAVMHPFRGRECSNDSNTNIHSHRWTLADITAGRLSTQNTGKPRDGYETKTPHPGGGFIHINDYTIQAAVSCQNSDATPPPINELGVFAHELGHALGLPDLYGTGGGSAFIPGSGNWDLMGTGAWGCTSTNDAQRPCHMGAWSKAALGWVVVEEVASGSLRSEVLEPVATGRRVLRVPSSDGSREYLLLENRQRIGSDQNLQEPGLLVWQIDPDVVDQGWPVNAVNALPARMGVRLRQADGRNDLGTGVNRGDPSDPFPGCQPAPIFEPCGVNRAFHLGTSPAALAHSGKALGIALTEIALVGAAPYDVAFVLDTRFTRGTLVAEVEMEALKVQSITIPVPGAPPAVLTWRLQSGTLPAGLTLSSTTGALQGETLQLGTFNFVLGAANGVNHETEVAVTLQVVSPTLAGDDLVAEYLGLPSPLSATMRLFLDSQGNQNGGLDLGDIRAYFQENPYTPMSGSDGTATVSVVTAPWVDPRQRLDP